MFLTLSRATDWRTDMYQPRDGAEALAQSWSRGTIVMR